MFFFVYYECKNLELNFFVLKKLFSLKILNFFYFDFLMFFLVFVKLFKVHKLYKMFSKVVESIHNQGKKNMNKDPKIRPSEEKNKNAKNKHP